MKIEVDKDSLLKSVNIADSIISSKNINTILANCHFQVTKNEITITSTDNEIGIRTKLGAVSEEECAFVANGKRLSGILKELPKGEVVLDVKDSYMIDIKTRAKEIKAHYTLIGLSSAEYPQIPFPGTNNMVEIEQSILRDMIRKVIYAAAVDTIKPVFNGLYLVSQAGKKITAVATDSRRLSLISRKLDNDVGIEEGVIIPLKTVSEIYRLLSSGGRCFLSIGKNQCFFKIGESEVVSRIVDGQFPNYNQVIPKERHIMAVIQTDKLMETLRRAMVFTKEPSNKILLHFNHNKLTVEAKTPDLGEAEEEITIESNTEEAISIGLNGHFLMDSLKEIDFPSLTFAITGQMSPVVLSPENDSDFLAVIMPIQIKSSQNE